MEPQTQVWLAGALGAISRNGVVGRDRRRLEFLALESSGIAEERRKQTSWHGSINIIIFTTLILCMLLASNVGTRIGLYVKNIPHTYHLTHMAIATMKVPPQGHYW